VGKILRVGILISGKISASVKASATKAVKSQGRVGGAIRKVNAQFAHAKSARKYGKLLGELKKKQKGLGRSSTRLDKRIAVVERRYHEARRAASRYGSELGKVTRKTRRLNEANAKAGGPSRRGVGTAIATAGGAALGLSVRAGMLAQEEAEYLRTVINASDGDKEAAVGRSIRQARAFARNSLASETEVLKIEYALNSAGLEEEVSRAGARVAHKVAKLTRGNSEQVAEIIGTAYNNLGDQMTGSAADKIKQIGNILTKTQFQYQIRDFGQLGESLKMASSTASSYKISLKQTAAAVGFLNNAGFQGARGGTSFQAMMRSMTKAGDELGFSMVRGADGGLDLMATLTELGGSLDGMDIDEKADLIGKIFGDEGKGAVIAFVKDLDKLKAGYEAVAKAAKGDLVNEDYDKFAKLAVGQWTILTQNIGQTATVIGSKLLPVLTPVLNVMGKIMGAIAWGLDNIPGVGLAIGLAATVVVGLGAALAVTTTATWAWNMAMLMSASTNGRAVGVVLSLTKGLWGLAARALPAVIVGTRALGVALMANPIGLLIGAIAIGALLIIKYWKPIKKFFGGIWTKIQGPVKKTWALFKTIFAWSPLGLLMRGFGAAFKAVRGLIRSPGSVAEKTWRLLKTVFSWSPLGLVKRAWDALPGVYKNVMGKIVGIAKVAMGKIKDFITAPIKMVGKLWDKIRGKGKKNKAAKPGDAINDNLVIAANENTPKGPKRPPFTPRRRPPPPPIPAVQAVGGGDTIYHLHISGVVDAENLVRQIKPALDQLAQEQREAHLHD